MIKDFPDVFPAELPGTTPPARPEAELHIDTGEHTPIRGTTYRMSPKELETLKNQLQELLDKKMIQPSASPWSSPVLFVRKKDGTLRMCVEYRAERDH